ncbi:AIPR protein [Mucilaginibacter gracilis]|uniref:AIPR protein n=1 Tax=Mucilaginibacter gracilis TaxID=423350 RepID=A0A495IYP6_9SPHI|nr:AIPR family protein [Mucilaginibacter gracilis]RKR81825.1 AIPR protein [Mucilaginibacter gracilis]
MDRITKSLLEEFVKQNDLVSLPEETAFEHFTGYLVTSNHYTETFSTEDIHIGAGGDGGIDTISIIVNGCLVTDYVEIEDLAETNGYLDVTLIFNQAERSSSFETAKIGQFSFGVLDFLSTEPALPQNKDLKVKYKIVSEIFNRSSKFKKGNPQCFLYYSTTGKWVIDANLVARRNAALDDLRGLTLFRRVELEFVDAERIQKLFRESKNAISTEINFPQKTALPELPNIEQAYIGLLSSIEYLKLIQNSNEEVITSLFYDNVRHWQEWNAVNKEIKETLEDPISKIYFPLLNNGVTIIARRITPTGNKFVLEDYQIVNGCQTSFVLYESRAYLNADVLVPVRIVATEDVEVRNSIIKATNRQTEVTQEQLFALADFPKKLETYFPTYEGSKRLYYERRSRQYNSDETVEKVRIINMTTLVRAFASVFLEVPHRTTRNYKALLKSVGTDIFNLEHKLEMYYVSAYSYYKLDYLFRVGAIPPTFKPARYHLLFVFRCLALNDYSSLPRPNSKDMVKYCDNLLKVLWDDTLVKQTFQEAAKIVNHVANGDLDRDSIRTEPFTEQIKIVLYQLLPQSPDKEPIKMIEFEITNPDNLEIDDRGQMGLF